MEITGYKKKHVWGNSTAYLMDCMEALPQFPAGYFDLAVVDPPYGIGMDSTHFVTKSSNASAKNYGKKDWDKEAPSDIYFNELIRVSKNQIVWGANHFIERINKNSSCWLVWDKNNGESVHADCELAWTSFRTAVKYIKYTWHGMRQQNMKQKEERIHPTQKPVALYAWTYHNYLPNGGKVVDTHLGSGSNRIAAHKAGNIEFIGFEVDEEYFDASGKRFEDYARQLKLF